MENESRLEFEYRMPMCLFILCLVMFPALGIPGIAAQPEDPGKDTLMTICGIVLLAFWVFFLVTSFFTLRHKDAHIVLDEKAIKLPPRWKKEPTIIPYTSIVEILIIYRNNIANGVKLKCLDRKPVVISGNYFKNDGEFRKMVEALYARVYPGDE